jgi:FkbM family methyltransferase
MQAANDYILQLAMQARGYDNCCTFDRTGEGKFLALVGKSNPQFCIDIGANAGDYAAALVKSTGATVVAFEPLPETFRKLDMLRSTCPERLFAYNCGVGNERAELELFYGEVLSTCATFSRPAANIDYVAESNTRSIRVPVVTLDEFLAEHSQEFACGEIDLVKIDTEGFEYNVLLGARETIRLRRPKFVQLEFNWHQLFCGHSLWKISELLPGYSVYQLLPYNHGMRRVDPKSPDSNIYRYSNFVFVRSDIEL